MLITSLITVILFSFFFYLSIKSASSESIKSLGKCVPMVLGMTSSVTIGLIIGVWIPDFLAIATIAAITVSSLVSFLFVKRFGINGIMEAQAASFMGAMMGAMLGVMLTSTTEVVLMLVASILFFIVSVGIMIALLNKKSGQKVVLFTKRIEFYVLLVLTVSVIGALGVHEISKEGSTDQENMEEEMLEHSH
ncbi:MULTISPECIES: hypothetical protein [Paraliobacillus]|uniref:hypothetical protein n=1 Tax=Paraliobacillus TaxID=200903 RepID=UPI000DD37E80|nr:MULTISPECIES: hypothetical protein [Paraliobacillus]